MSNRDSRLIWEQYTVINENVYAENVRFYSYDEFVDHVETNAARGADDSWFTTGHEGTADDAGLFLEDSIIAVIDLENDITTLIYDARADDQNDHHYHRNQAPFPVNGFEGPAWDQYAKEMDVQDMNHLHEQIMNTASNRWKLKEAAEQHMDRVAMDDEPPEGPE